MKKVRWVKQLTRENTLLDRSLRVLSYHRSIREIGKASISNTLIVGEGNITSLYYLQDDYARQRAIIAKEFSGVRIQRMARQIVQYLEAAHRWTRIQRSHRLTPKNFAKTFSIYLTHLSHARGAIFYGYWGEPSISRQVRAALARKLPANKVDHALSVLSAPQPVAGILQKIRTTHQAAEREYTRLMRRLKLTGTAREAVEILRWFTYFYEAGERIADQIYTLLISQLHVLLPRETSKDLIWYDVASLRRYFKGHRLSPQEIERRKDFFIIEMLRGKWRVLSGKHARQYFRLHVEPVQVEHPSHIAGTTAHPGKVEGTVKIVVTRSDQKKMKKGDILISPMTTIWLMGAIRKAAAIVTDEGGMTAHAAIVARELKTPCIVGTKIATKVLKDGDRVEVDATKGIVRKI